MTLNPIIDADENPLGDLKGFSLRHFTTEYFSNFKFA